MMPASATPSPTETVSVTLDVPADLLERFLAVSPATIKHLFEVALPQILSVAEGDKALGIDNYYAEDFADVPLDEAYIAELIAADEENKRAGFIPFEEILRQAEADSGPGFVERIRARVAARNAD